MNAGAATPPRHHPIDLALTQKRAAVMLQCRPAGSSGARSIEKGRDMGAQWKAKGKAQAADARGKLFGKLAKEIMVAARSGADPAANARLRLVVEQARKVSMPKDTLERAIKKGAGLTGEAVNFEHAVSYTHLTLPTSDLV